MPKNKHENRRLGHADTELLYAALRFIHPNACDAAFRRLRQNAKINASTPVYAWLRGTAASGINTKKVSAFLKLINLLSGPKLASSNDFSNAARIKGKNDLIYFLKNELDCLDSENSMVILLDKTSRPVFVKKESKRRLFECNIASGSLNEALMKYKPCKVILVHTHPGGNIAPSSEDNISTRKLQKTIKSFESVLVDHFIVSKKKDGNIIIYPTLRPMYFYEKGNCFSDIGGER